MSDRSLHASKTTPWKSIDELAHGTQETGEFTPNATSAPVFDSSVSRRGFMALVSASMALTAAACRRPEQKLVPAVKSRENATPGLPLYYTSVYSQRNVAYGALVKTREGRPIKVKGNELHGSNKGTTSSEMQASLLALYDPDRIRRPRLGKGPTTFDAAASKIAAAITEAKNTNKKVAVFVGEHCSPTFSELVKAFAALAPNTVVATIPSIVADGAAQAAKATLGIDGEIVPDLSLATVIVSVDADFLGADPLAVHNTARFASMRSPSAGKPSMSHLTVCEAQYSLTGMNADARVRLHPSQIESFLGALEQEIGGSSIGASIAGSASADTRKAAAAAAARLKGAGSSGVVLAGKHLSGLANAIALAINNTLGSLGAGKIVDPANVLPNSGAKSASIDAVVNEMASGQVHVALFCDVNPEYSASSSFRKAMAKVAVLAAVNLYEDETASACSISIPGSHWLESWGTAVTYNGMISVQQPTIAPMCEGIPSTPDTLIAIGRKVDAAFLTGTETYADYVRTWVTNTVLAQAPGTTWNALLEKGAIGTVQVGASASFNPAGASVLTSSPVATGMVVQTVPSLALYDGQLSNNGWLQELPDPVTKVTWDNVALISPSTAVALGLASDTSAASVAKANEKVITVETKNGAVDLPVIVQPGMADNVITTQLGYGRSACGTVAVGVGSNGYLLGAPGYTSTTNVKIVSGAKHRVATTQAHHTLSDGNGDRPVAKMLTLGDVAAKNFEVVGEHFYDQGMEGKFKVPLSATADYQYKGHRWGMVIDMSSCTGCSSCIIACQSENNIPVVGKDQVLTGREMHWIRLDRYYTGDMDSPGAIVEPMLCQHCENAPCENVCPVAATTHSPEGLNEMTYNRCVGTRYCLNNCPYKVRRFNFLNYSKMNERQPLDLANNPEVTNRFRGVMEKCTFCVQRLHEAKWHARDAGRSRVLDGEAITACQEACPAGAIIFGDMNDPSSRVSVAKQNERGFRVLSDINVRPSVTYLAKVVNAPKS